MDTPQPGAGSLVSVIVIFLDEAAFLHDAIASVRGQTHADWELLLVDDGSSDASSDIARQAAADEPHRVRYLEHPGHRNLGMSASRNLGLARARGEYVAFLDADDVLLPRALERQVADLRAHPGVDMVYGDTEFWYSWTGRDEDALRDTARGIGIPPGTVIDPPKLMLRCFPLGAAPSPATCSLLARRAAVERAGGFEPAFRGLFEDQAFLAKMYLTARIVVSSDRVARYRMRPDSCVALSTRAGQNEEATYRFLLWLEALLSVRGVADPDIWRALDKALWPHRYPRRHRVSERGRAFVRRMRHDGWSVLNRAVRRLAGKSTGTLEAHPNPIRTTDRFALGVTILSWSVRGATAVEVRTGAPDGPLLARSGPVGATQRGIWVEDGAVFYLQDVSSDRPLEARHTIATARVRVRPVRTPDGRVVLPPESGDAPAPSQARR